MYTSKGALRAAWEGIRNWKGKKYRVVKDVTDDYVFNIKEPIHAVDGQGRNTLHEEGQIQGGQEAMVNRREQGTQGSDEGRAQRERCLGQGQEDRQFGRGQARKVACLHCGHTEYSDCPSFYRHLGDTLPYGCLLKGGVE